MPKRTTKTTERNPPGWSKDWFNSSPGHDYPHYPLEGNAIMDILEIRMRESIMNVYGVNLSDVKYRSNSDRRIAEYGPACIEWRAISREGVVRVEGSKGILPNGVVKRAIPFRYENTPRLWRILKAASNWVDFMETFAKCLEDHGMEIEIANNYPYAQLFSVRRGGSKVIVGNMGSARADYGVYVVNHSQMSDEEQALADDVLNLSVTCGESL